MVSNNSETALVYNALVYNALVYNRNRDGSSLEQNTALLLHHGDHP